MTHPINTSDWWQVSGEPRARHPPLSQLSPRAVADWLQPTSPLSPGRDFLIIDVRRADCETMIPGAINLPAHSLPHSLPALLPLLASVPRLVFHCNSSKGRGPRAAGWVADALQDYYASRGEQRDVDDQVFVLQGGIVAWKEAFGQQDLEKRGSVAEGLVTRHL